jgi:hypothetical protein
MPLKGYWGDITDKYDNDIDLYGDGKCLNLDISDSFMENNINIYLTKKQVTQLRDLLNDVLKEDF